MTSITSSSTRCIVYIMPHSIVVEEGSRYHPSLITSDIFQALIQESARFKVWQQEKLKSDTKQYSRAVYGHVWVTLQVVVNESCKDWGYTVFTVYCCSWGMQVHDVKQKCSRRSLTSIWANLLSRYWIIKASWDEPWLCTEPAVRWRARRRTGSNLPDISLLLSTTWLRKLTRLLQQRHCVWGNETVSCILAE